MRRAITIDDSLLAEAESLAAARVTGRRLGGLCGGSTGTNI
jgi:hypothetical protein